MKKELYQELFNFMYMEHDVMLMDDDFNTIEAIIEKHSDNAYQTEMPSEEETVKHLEELLQEKYPVFSQMDAEKHHDRRHTFGYGFELGIKWFKSQLKGGE